MHLVQQSTEESVYSIPEEHVLTEEVGVGNQGELLEELLQVLDDFPC